MNSPPPKKRISSTFSALVLVAVAGSSSSLREVHAHTDTHTHAHTHTHTYIYICCRVKTWSKTWVFESKLGPRLRQNLVENVFCLFPPPSNFIVFFGYLEKTQIVCRGAKIFFGQSVSASKRGLSKKVCTFVFVFLCWRKKKRENMKSMETKFSKKKKNSVFGWLWTRKMFFLQRWHFLRIGEHYLCLEAEKKPRIFVATICFWKMVLSWCPFKVTKHYKNRGFSRHMGKPKMALLVAKVPFWEGASKGALPSVIPKSGALLKTLFL